MVSVFLTQNDGAILGPIAKVLGLILNAIFEFLSNFGIENAGLCIIIFTFLVNALMIPLTIKQQKFTKLSSKMTPEINKINENTKIQLYKNCYAQTKDGILTGKTKEEYTPWTTNINEFDLTTKGNFISKESFYDSDTHYHLGEYLRYYRGQTGIDLMPLYNCSAKIFSVSSPAAQKKSH